MWGLPTSAFLIRLQDWSDELFGELSKAGGKAYCNFAVGYNNVVLADATKHGIAVGNTPGNLRGLKGVLSLVLSCSAWISGEGIFSCVYPIQESKEP